MLNKYDFLSSHIKTLTWVIDAYMLRTLHTISLIIKIIKNTYLDLHLPHLKSHRQNLTNICMPWLRVEFERLKSHHYVANTFTL